MPLDAGAIPTADEIGYLQTRVFRAVASSDLVGSVTTTDITGASVTFTTATSNAVFVAIGVFDCDQAGTHTNVTSGFLAVNGTRDAAQAIYQGNVASDRGTMAQTWSGTLPVGSNTLKLQGTVPASSEINATHTTLTVLIYEAVL